MKALSLLVLLATCTAVAEAHGVTDCDLLAANPEDQDIIAPPVPRAEVDLPRAIAACEAEVALHPDNVRARYQLSRVLAYAGESDRATAEMKRAADDGYRQAQFVYGLLIERDRPGAPADHCVTEKYWLQSARAGRQAARVSYVRHAVQGRFDACPPAADKAEMQRFLDAAVPDSGSYYERLLLTDLSAQLASWEPPAVALTECDRLAAHPEDPDAIAPGVPSSKVDRTRAIAACDAAVSADPDNARLRYQLARALAYDGQTKRATDEMKRSADAGHRQAQFVYGLFVARHRDDAPRDLCVAADYWLRSAQAGRQAARVIYLQYELDGKFDACRQPGASAAELGTLLQAAKSEAADFYEKLLVNELASQLEQRLAMRSIE